jgi:hypothetical protein
MAFSRIDAAVDPQSGAVNREETSESTMVAVIASEAKQSRNAPVATNLDCFASLAMTKEANSNYAGG